MEFITAPGIELPVTVAAYSPGVVDDEAVMVSVAVVTLVLTEIGEEIVRAGGVEPGGGKVIAALRVAEKSVSP